MSLPKDHLRVTIAFPTYNRIKHIKNRIEEILAHPLADRFNILIIDNASPDGTATKLKNHYSHTNILILRNEANMGFTRNYLRLFDHCSTDWMFICSDEDRPALDAITELEPLLNAEQPPSCIIGSVNAIQNGEQYCERRKLGNPATPYDVDYTNYISGVIFHLPQTQPIHHFVSGMVKSNYFSATYPQRAIPFGLFTEGNVMTCRPVLAERIAYEKVSWEWVSRQTLGSSDTPSEILSFATLESRFKEWLSGFQFLLDLRKRFCSSTETLKRSDALITFHLENLYTYLLSAFAAEDAAIHQIFIRSTLLSVKKNLTQNSPEAFKLMEKSLTDITPTLPNLSQHGLNL